MVAAGPSASGAPPVERVPVNLDFADSAVSSPPWRQLATHLFAGGIEDIYVFPLETDVAGLHVVRVLASGLAPAGGGLQHISQRTLDHLLTVGGLG
jgi:ribosomal protein S12 methylthiotransferase accessory factor YcaO